MSFKSNLVAYLLTYPWPTPDLPLTYSWPTRDLPVTYPWPTPDLPQTYPWPTRDLPLTCLFRSFSRYKISPNELSLVAYLLTYPLPPPDLPLTYPWSTPHLPWPIPDLPLTCLFRSFSRYKISPNELSLRHTLRFSNSYIFVIRYLRPWMFQIMSFLRPK